MQSKKRGVGVAVESRGNRSLGGVPEPITEDAEREVTEPGADPRQDPAGLCRRGDREQQPGASQREQPDREPNRGPHPTDSVCDQEPH